ncbi:MAG: STAS/SEC14 domain-containing protein [Candidatus Methylacidiphilaceae bacterium]
MFKLLEGMPPDVLGIEASGKVTHKDYQDILIPKAEALMAKGPVKALFVVAPEFAGYELKALWDDSVFGLKHWRDFRRVAVVADQEWIHGVMTMFRPLILCEFRLFKLAELAAAKSWITSS